MKKNHLFEVIEPIDRTMCDDDLDDEGEFFIEDEVRYPDDSFDY
jgi:hypothetical protein